MKHKFSLLTVGVVSAFFIGCTPTVNNQPDSMDEEMELKQKVEAFAQVPLKCNIEHLTESEKAVLNLCFDAAKIMDDLFWQEAYGDKESFLASLPNDTYREFALINYGPWERLNGNAPFVPGYGEKPLGANFYPKDARIR